MSHQPLPPYGSKPTVLELMALQLLADGHSYKSAAKQMNISWHTLNMHTRRLYVRLGVHSSTHAVATAMRQGLIK